jgi:hypothetical protein
LHGFTPFLKGEQLGPEQHIAVTPAAQPAVPAATHASHLLATASSFTVIKGGGSAATPLVLANTFVPLAGSAALQQPSKALAAAGGKLRPGGGAPPLLPSGGSGAFTIPAYSRPFTQLDFISTGKLSRAAAFWLKELS